MLIFFIILSLFYIFVYIALYLIEDSINDKLEKDEKTWEK